MDTGTRVQSHTRQIPFNWWFRFVALLVNWGVVPQLPVQFPTQRTQTPN